MMTTLMIKPEFATQKQNEGSVKRVDTASRKQKRLNRQKPYKLRTFRD